MERMQTKALVEGAIFAGITTLLGVIYYYTQSLGIIGLIWPVPTIIVGYRNGLKASILSAMSAGLIVSLLTQPLVGVGLLIGFGLPGILMGYLIKRKVNPYIIIFLCAVVLALTTVAQFLISLKVSGIDAIKFFTDLDATFKSQIQVTIDIYRKFGIDEKNMQLMGDQLRQTIEVMKHMLPALLILSGLTSSFIDYKLTRLILKRIGCSIPDTENFSKWRLQKPYSYIFIGLVVVVVAASFSKLPLLTDLALNVSMVISLISSVMGLSVVLYFAKVYGDRNGIPKALRIAIVTLIVLTFMQYIVFLGLFDMVFDFRKLRAKKQC